MHIVPRTGGIDIGFHARDVADMDELPKRLAKKSPRKSPKIWLTNLLFRWLYRRFFRLVTIAEFEGQRACFIAAQH
jgi:hypothetical protein